MATKTESNGHIEVPKDVVPKPSVTPVRAITPAPPTPPPAEPIPVKLDTSNRIEVAEETIATPPPVPVRETAPPVAPEIPRPDEATAAIELLDGNGTPGEKKPDALPPTKILLIEDDSTIRMLLEMGLRKHNFDCTIAENGKVAQDLLKVVRPDLIVVDLLMPVMDGIAFIQWLRQVAKDSPPVLVFTTVDDPKVTAEVMKSGADFFARKPLVQLTSLVEQINKLVNLGRQPRAPSP